MNIKFVDLRKTRCIYRFRFARDGGEVFKFNNAIGWNTWEQFMLDFTADNHETNGVLNILDFKEACPKWAFWMD